MKLQLITTKNGKGGSLELPVTEKVRPDLIKRAVLSLQSRRRQKYGADERAGLKHSTRVSRRRRDYRGSYGHGISRVPRKVLNRSGRRMGWVGAEAPGTVGGRRAHPPKATKEWAKKINRKENRKAINSAIAAAMDVQTVKTRGHKVPDAYPFALADDFDKITKTSELAQALAAIGFADDLTRAKGGAKSVLIVTESEELRKAAKNLAGVDAASAAELNAELLAPGTHPGRATLFTEASVKVLGGEPKKASKSAKKAEEKA